MKAKVYVGSASGCTHLASFGARRSTPSTIDGVNQKSAMLVRNARGTLFASDRDLEQVCDTRLEDGHAGFKDGALARPGYRERIWRCAMADRPTIGRRRAAEMRIDPNRIGSDGLTLDATPRQHDQPGPGNAFLTQAVLILDLDVDLRGRGRRGPGQREGDRDHLAGTKEGEPEVVRETVIGSLDGDPDLGGGDGAEIDQIEADAEVAGSDAEDRRPQINGSALLCFGDREVPSQSPIGDDGRSSGDEPGHDHAEKNAGHGLIHLHIQDR